MYPCQGTRKGSGIEGKEAELSCWDTCFWKRPWQKSGQSHPCSWCGNCTLITRLFQIIRVLFRFLWYENHIIWIGQSKMPVLEVHFMLTSQISQHLSSVVKNTPRDVITPWSQLFLWCKGWTEQQQRAGAEQYSGWGRLGSCTFLQLLSRQKVLLLTLKHQAHWK